MILQQKDKQIPSNIVEFINHMKRNTYYGAMVIKLALQAITKVVSAILTECPVLIALC